MPAREAALSVVNFSKRCARALGRQESHELPYIDMQDSHSQRCSYSDHPGANTAGAGSEEDQWDDDPDQPGFCCGCVSLRQAVTAIGCTLLAIHSAGLTVQLITAHLSRLSFPHMGADKPWYQHIGLYRPADVIIVCVVVYLIHVAFNVTLLWAVHRRRRWPLLGWTGYHLVSMLAYTGVWVAAVRRTCCTPPMLALTALAVALLAPGWYWVSIGWRLFRQQGHADTLSSRRDAAEQARCNRLHAAAENAISVTTQNTRPVVRRGDS